MLDTVKTDIYGDPIVYEGTEWDDVWVECARDNESKRILMIGDSITRGFRAILKEELACRALPNTIATSKAVDNPNFERLIDYHLTVGYEYSAVHIMSGPHGPHLNIEKFEDGFERLVKFVAARLPKAKILIGTYPKVRFAGDLSQIDEERNQKTEQRNAAARRVAERLGAELNDLYYVIGDDTELYSPDGLHLSSGGYKLLAEATAKKFAECNVL